MYNYSSRFKYRNEYFRYSYNSKIDFVDFYTYLYFSYIDEKETSFFFAEFNRLNIHLKKTEITYLKFDF